MFRRRLLLLSLAVVSIVAATTLARGSIALGVGWFFLVFAGTNIVLTTWRIAILRRPRDNRPNA
jgi:hypothetical protein